MSEENVEAVWHANDAFNRGDIDAMLAVQAQLPAGAPVEIEAVAAL
jgi:hypothetical protein